MAVLITLERLALEKDGRESVELGALVLDGRGRLLEGLAEELPTGFERAPVEMPDVQRRRGPDVVDGGASQLQHTVCGSALTDQELASSAANRTSLKSSMAYSWRRSRNEGAAGRGSGGSGGVEGQGARGASSELVDCA